MLLICMIPGRISAQLLHFLPHPAPENFQAQLLIQDGEGLIWVGGNSGLMQFDGLNWKAFVRPDSQINQAVTALYESPDHTLWIGYEDGKIMYVSQGSLVLFRPEEGLPEVPVKGILTDRNGVLWIGTYGEGLYYWKNKRLYNINIDDGLPDDYVYGIETNNQGEIWAATDRGIGICRLENNQKHIRVLDKSHGLADDIITALAKDAQGHLWVGTYEGGICKYLSQTDTFLCSPEWNYSAINTLLPLDNEILVGTQSHGRISIKNWNVLPGEDQPKNKIFQLYKDKEGNIWQVDHRQGLLSAHSSLAFLPYYPIPVQAIYNNQKGQLLFYNEAGLIQFDPETGSYQLIETPPDLHLTSIYVDDFGYIWLGTLGQGIWRKHPNKKHFKQFTERHGLVNDNVLSIDGRKGEVWFATFGGASRFLLDQSGELLEIENFDDQDGLGINYIYHVYLDSKGRAWFATDGKGIRWWENGKINYFTSLEGATFYSITEDIQGRMWFSCADSGLFYLEDKEIQKYDLAAKPTASILGLESGLEGEILLIHPEGLRIINSNARHVNALGKETGLMDLGKGLNMLSKGKDGAIWIGSNQGVIRYHPSKVSTSSYPKPRINDIQIYLESIGTPFQTDFSYDQNHLAFDYIGLWYRDPQAVRYQYRLKGQHEDWITSQNTRAIYPNLPPGSYTFQVRSSVDNNYDQVPLLQFSFAIHPPFWRTWWFAFVLLLLMGAVLFLWIRYREEQVKIAERLKRDKIRSEFEILKNQINPHFLFNSFNTLISTIEENPSKAVGFVERLSDFFRSILEVREQNLISLAEELKLLDNFYHLQKQRYGDAFLLNINLSPAKHAKMIAPLTLQLLVENAIKHNIVSPRKPLAVDIFESADNYLAIRNNLQLRRDRKPSTQLGLTNIQHRYQLLGDQQVAIIQNSDFFQVNIPLINQIS